MDMKKRLQEQIKNCRRRMNFAGFLDRGICFAAVGGILGILCELFSLCRPFYYVHLTAGICFLTGFLAGVGIGVYKRADMKQAARRLDSFGLKERMITAWEQMDQETEFAIRQRQDALLHYERKKEQIKISLCPDKKHILALFLSIAAVIGLGLIPSPVRDLAKVRHQVQEKAEEEKEDLEELVEALEGVDMDSLTEEQKMQLKALAESMQLSKEELSGAKSWESLASAMERLNYKYEQAGQSLEQLASQMKNPEAAGVASAEALAKALANPDGGQMASTGTPNVSAGNNNNGQENGDGSGENSGEGNGSESGDGTGDGAGNGSENGSGNETGNGTGNGNNGDGNGSGNGNGNGSGNGTGNGTGSGRGTGSSNHVHDYVSIPNEIADDSSLTGNKTGDQASDYYRTQNGLSWEGEHVDYNSVIGEYTDNAYEGIAKGRYPSGMEPVIRDYFENLNK